MDGQARIVAPRAGFKTKEEILLAGTLFAELGDMVAGYGSETAGGLSDERMTAIAYVSETLILMGAQLVDVAGGDPNAND